MTVEMMDNENRASFHTGSLNRRHLSGSRIANNLAISKNMGTVDNLTFNHSASSVGVFNNTAHLASNITTMQDMFKNLKVQLIKQKQQMEEKAKHLLTDEPCPYCNRIGKSSDDNIDQNSEDQNFYNYNDSINHEENEGKRLVNK